MAVRNMLKTFMSANEKSRLKWNDYYIMTIHVARFFEYSMLWILGCALGLR